MSENSQAGYGSTKQITDALFDGIRLHLFDSAGNLVSSTLAVSGAPLAQNPDLQGIGDLGPIPEGTYSFSAERERAWVPQGVEALIPEIVGTRVHIRGDERWGSGWGNYLTRLVPEDNTNTHGRDGFYLHGSRDGNTYGSIGCIDLNKNDTAVFTQILNRGAPRIRLVVEYDDTLRSGFHPVYEDHPDFDTLVDRLEDGYGGVTPRIDRDRLLDGGFSREFAEDPAFHYLGPSYNEGMGDGNCFVAGTTIDMWDGSQKPIEEICIDDWVTAYDEDGNLVPGQVSRLFQRQAEQVLDVFGLKVTPGHVTLCGDGRHAGQHVPLIDILRSDGAFVRRDGTKVRACTGAELGTAEDGMVWAVTGEVAEGGAVRVRDKGQIRIGTRFITSNGTDVSVAEILLRNGARVTNDGLIENDDGGKGMPFHWTFTDMLPAPEDYILQRSARYSEQAALAGELGGNRAN